jgi:hypothetical protein
MHVNGLILIPLHKENPVSRDEVTILVLLAFSFVLLVKGEIFGFTKDEQLRKRLPRILSLIKNEIWGLEKWSDNVLLSTIDDVEQGLEDVAFRTPRRNQSHWVIGRVFGGIAIRALPRRSLKTLVGHEKAYISKNRNGRCVIAGMVGI